MKVKGWLVIVVKKEEKQRCEECEREVLRLYEPKKKKSDVTKFFLPLRNELPTLRLRSDEGSESTLPGCDHSRSF